MKVRRVITACNDAGKSVFWSIDHAPRTHDYVHIPGMSNTQVWATAPVPSLTASIADDATTERNVLPPPGGTRLMFVEFPPDSVVQSPQFDGRAAGLEDLQVLPGLAERFEADNPSMHRTDTIDYGIVLRGEIWLELDDGQMQHLKQHDVVVQHGTRHAWRNKSQQITLMVFVLIGARRDAPGDNP